MLVSDTGTTFFSGTLLGLLLALVVLCLVVITVLAVIVVRQRRQIASKNKSIVRNASLYLSLKHKDFPNLGGGRPEAELSQVELVSLMQLIRKMLYGCVLLLPAAPAMAQESTDTTYVFRFVPTDDMFYVPLGNNEAELQRLEDTVEKYYDDILAGDIPIRVDGYCNSGGDRKTNLKLAKDRSNRVKSELINFCWVMENCFITKNHSGEGDYVLVRLVVPKRLSSPPSSSGDGNEAASDNSANVPENTPNNPETPAEEPQTQSVQAEQPTTTETMQAPESLPTGPLVGHPRTRLVDFVVVERQGPKVCLVGSLARSAPLYRKGEARLHRCDVQGRGVQLQAVRHGQAGRPDGRRHHGRLWAAPEQCLVAGLQPCRGLPTRRL